MFGYIYKTRNKSSGRIYVGQRHGAFDRKYLGSGILITRAVQKYGRDKFCVRMMAIAVDQNQLDAREREAIHVFKSLGFKMYNLAEGGRCKVVLGRKVSSETREKIRAALLAKRGSYQTAETKRKMSEAAKARLATPKGAEHLMRIHSMKKKKHVITPETRAKMIATKMSRPRYIPTEEHITKMIDGRNAWLAKKALTLAQSSMPPAV